MAEKLSISEVFLLAENIEKQGREFYLGAAKNSQDPMVKEVMAFLAEEEARHEGIFAGLRKKFFGSNDLYINNDDDEATKYITNTVNTHVFNVEKDVAALLGAIQTPRSALEMAINFEKDTIACFTAFKKVVKDETNLIDRLILEEQEHIKKIQRVLDSI
ncbi:MAG: ferritin family protein [Sedimentisphaerales bacterium]|nr:ferritin family protein [Sedimentisphaerales bacterium]MBN2842787.1 ferritin family protein [Sedimentisphaerales bacterium]